MILIISNKFDQHVDIVIQRLNKEGVPFFRWNIEDFPQSHRFYLHTNGIDGDIKLLLSAENRKIDFDSIKKVWYRRPGETRIDSEITDPAAIKLALNETLFTLRGLWLLLGDRVWISNPFSNQRMGNKLFQLKLAQKVGLKVPETIITNDQKAAKNFLRSHKEVIAKTISGGLTRLGDGSKPGYTIYTTKLSDGILSDQLKSVRFAPTLFQVYIPKKIELRITIIQENVFTCAIESQKSEKTKVDWRRYDLKNVPHYSFQLPQLIEKQLIEFMKEGDLKFGTFDMILTPQNEYIFLECNPNGQWYWIEQLTDLPITERFIQLLKS
jgi:glutathione synthase/RimK-type ligase-like ATP-grasp enzyme